MPLELKLDPHDRLLNARADAISGAGFKMVFTLIKFLGTFGERFQLKLLLASICSTSFLLCVTHAEEGYDATRELINKSHSVIHCAYLGAIAGESSSSKLYDLGYALALEHFAQAKDMGVYTVGNQTFLGASPEFVEEHFMGFHIGRVMGMWEAQISSELSSKNGWPFAATLSQLREARPVRALIASEAYRNRNCAYFVPD